MYISIYLGCVTHATTCMISPRSSLPPVYISPDFRLSPLVPLTLSPPIQFPLVAYPVSVCAFDWPMTYCPVSTLAYCADPFCSHPICINCTLQVRMTPYNKSLCGISGQTNVVNYLYSLMKHHTIISNLLKSCVPDLRI